MNYLDIKKWRNQIEVNPIKAAELLGVDLETYTNWENGVHPVSKAVTEACTNLNTRYAGTGGQHNILIASIDEYKNAYRVYFGSEPVGKHLVYAAWKTIPYKLIDFTPDNPVS